MINFLNDRMRHLLSSFFIVIMATAWLNAQNGISVPDIEKIYIHTDRTTYTLGESLWYKAYSVYAYNNLLYNKSNILYVELISPDSKIVKQNKTRLEAGMGHGDFHLSDSIGIKAGTYQLRAYTNYSRNFGTDFIFKKEIKIIDVFDKLDTNNNISNKQESIGSNGVENSEYTYKVQFFPEGGSLVNDVESIVAFKAEYTNGMPIEVKGKIYDSDGNLITLFITSHDGMGKFPFKPVKGKNYHAKITDANNVIKEEQLPKALETGYLLGYKKVNGNDFITVKTNQETLSSNLNAPLTLICATRGVSYLEGTQALVKTTLSFQLAKNDFPEGISQITLYDANSRPQSERLIFIEKENDLDIILETDKKTYQPKEKVTLKVLSKTETGNPVPASYSLSCTDTNGDLTHKNYGTNIASYFLMESDIKGAVNNPSYYFDINNPKRFEHLDLLLLTQGWRDFLWKTIPTPKSNIHYSHENDFLIAGHVKQVSGTKPMANNSVTLALINKNGLNLQETVTDSLGRFKFEKLAFYGPTTMVLNSKNEKGKGKGEVLVYPIQKAPMEVDFEKKDEFFPLETTTIKDNIYKKYIMYGVAPENVLDEVEIIAKKKTVPNIYGTPDFSYVMGDDTPSFSDIYQLIRFKVPGVMVDPDSIRFMRYNGPAHIILDGVPIYDISILSSILPDNVDKIDVLKGASAAIFGSDAANGVLAIYTKDPTANSPSQTKYYNINQKIEGFYNARVFYTTNLEEPDFEYDAKIAVRNTLFWDPYMFPNASTGVSEKTYYNSDVTTTVKVSLEGITQTGIPVVLQTNYVIEK
ncbi:TonB-dependent receptor [Mariniflexile sp.]|uniref:TonB-dependent receptor n=1 Tax=Mariniflexile sp. TaxID=1979402 RepID=UPI00356440E8